MNIDEARREADRIRNAIREVGAGLVYCHPSTANHVINVIATIDANTLHAGSPPIALAELRVDRRVPPGAFWGPDRIAVDAKGENHE